MSSRTARAAEDRSDLGPLAVLVDAIAARVVEQLRPLFEGKAGDTWVDRRTCGHSQRWWDRSAGKLFAVQKDGRRLVARRADVDAAFARETKFARKVSPPSAPADEDEAELLAAGVHLNGGTR